MRRRRNLVKRKMMWIDDAYAVIGGKPYSSNCGLRYRRPVSARQCNAAYPVGAVENCGLHNMLGIADPRVQLRTVHPHQTACSSSSIDQWTASQGSPFLLVSVER